MRAEELQRHLTAWRESWHTPTLAYRTTITFSSRLHRSLGRCNPNTGQVRLNARLLDGPPDLLKEVLCHEVAHVAVYMLYGRKARAHGPEWKHLMRLAGYEPSVRHAHEELPEAVRAATHPKFLYDHRCPVCGAARTARRPVRNWRCRACREAGLEGRLEITTRPAARVHAR